MGIGKCVISRMECLSDNWKVRRGNPTFQDRGGCLRAPSALQGTWKLEALEGLDFHAWLCG